MERYNFKIVENKWQTKWENEKTFLVGKNSNIKKFY